MVMLKVLSILVLVTSTLEKELQLPVDGETKERHPDVDLNAVEIIEKYGYPVERHTNIQTTDGYLLEMHRIPHGRNNSHLVNRPAVFLMHGLLCSSADWVMMGPTKGLAFILADRGYDVWLGNARGNTWSRKHIKYDPDKDEGKFWDFSWHEIGVIDVPAMIDRVLFVTGQEKIQYIGHSQGTTAFFVMTSEKPEYNDKINLMTALAPIAYMKNCPNPIIQIAAQFEAVGEVIANIFGLHEFLPSSEFMTEIGHLLCNDEAITQPLCTNILFLIAGYDEAQLNKTMIPVILSKVPAGAATKQVLHYGQEVKTGFFRQYDYGWLENLVKYGSPSPPAYNVGNIVAPVALFYGDKDHFTAYEDVIQLYRSLPHAVYNYKLNGFNHLDFLWGIDVPTLLYDRVINLMDRYK